MMRACGRLGVALVLACVLCGRAGVARAGGYDTPILYSARHMGMGGTAIGYVDDPSAVFHNPAGLSGVQGLSLLADFSLLLGSITSSPGFPGSADGDGNYPTRESKPIVGPFFMLAAGYRLPILDRLRVGFALYPIASASGEYEDEFLSRATIDKTRLVFFEASPAVSFDVLDNLSIGAGYRLTYAQLERVQGWADEPNLFDFSLSGLDGAGFRAGVQYRPLRELSFGVVYRHVVDIELSADRGRAIADVVDPKTTFTLPSKLGFGARANLGALGLALDLEHALQSQNDRSVIEGTNADPALNGKHEAVTNYFEWHDAITARVGAEYTFWSVLAGRVGYVFDGVVGNEGYPSAFGTPPAPSHTFTVGAGYDLGSVELNLAVAHRFVSTKVKPSDIITSPACATCSKPGEEYSLRMTGIYADVSWDLGEQRPAAEP